MATTAAESLTGIEAVQALGLGPAFNDAFAQESRQSLKEGVKGKRSPRVSSALWTLSLRSPSGQRCGLVRGSSWLGISPQASSWSSCPM